MQDRFDGPGDGGLALVNRGYDAECNSAAIVCHLFINYCNYPEPICKIAATQLSFCSCGVLVK